MNSASRWHFVTLAGRCRPLARERKINDEGVMWAQVGISVDEGDGKLEAEENDVDGELLIDRLNE